MMNSFNFKNILIEQKIKVLIRGIAFGFLSLFLYSKRIKVFDIMFIGFIWFFIELSMSFIEYRKRKTYFRYFEKTLNNLDKKYLLSECVEELDYSIDKVYYSFIKRMSKNMIEEISNIKRSRREYKEYIETWVHEVKTPISVIKLILENNKDAFSNNILLEVSSIERYIEQALFYARSETLEKDYLIRELDLKQCINKVIIKNRKQCILNNTTIEIFEKSSFVYSDEKWINFIIEQIVNNAIKYKKDGEQNINFIIGNIKNGVCLEIKDCGQGIKGEELGRVFEKGFTGSERRGNNNSTGIGLYLVKKLCDKLGIVVGISSKYGYYTSIKLIFPKGEFANNNIFE